MKYGQTTLILISVNIIISYFIFSTSISNQIFLFDLLGFSYVILDLYRVVTYAFVHGWLEHLLTNMLFLFIYGFFLEKKIGSENLLKLYFFTLIAGVLIYGLFSTSEKVCIGASVAICGIIGAYCADKKSNFILVLFAILSISSDCYLWYIDVQDSVAHLAHILGFILGFIFYKFQNKQKKYDVI